MNPSNKLIKKENKELSVAESAALKENISVEDMQKVLETYSTSAKIGDTKWIIDKINLDESRTNSERTIYVGASLLSLRIPVQKYVLSELNKGKKVRSISHKISHVIQCLTASGKETIEDITPIDILKIHTTVFVNDRKLKTNLEVWIDTRNFFKESNYFEQYSTMMKYVLPPFPDKHKIDAKYIPEEVARHLDVVMKMENMDNAHKTMYWLLRLIPNRITEVLSMTVNCLKQIDENNYMLSIPTFKQSGRYVTGAMKLIQIEYAGIAAYLIDLIKAQIEIAKSFKTELSGNFLFYGPTYGIYSTKDGKYNIKIQNNEAVNMTQDSARYFLKRVCEAYDIRDADGNPYKVTTHQFRHNAISDRMNSGLFRSIDIVALTAHHNFKMIEQSYTHVTTDMLIANREIYFRGRIINTDNPLKEARILKKPFANRISGLGICSDIRGCSNSRFRCMRCPHMIPDIESLPFCEEEKASWLEKKNKAEQIGNNEYAELCAYNAESYDIVINKIAALVSNDTTDESINTTQEVSA